MNKLPRALVRGFKQKNIDYIFHTILINNPAASNRVCIDDDISISTQSPVNKTNKWVKKYLQFNLSKPIFPNRNEAFK